MQRAILSGCACALFLVLLIAWLLREPRSAITVQVPGAPYGILAIGSDAGRAYMPIIAPSGAMALATIDLRAGRLLRTAATGSNTLAVAVDAPAHRVFAMDNGGGGSLEVIDARTGTLRSRLRYGASSPQTAFVDSSLHRLFVLLGASDHHRIVVYDTRTLRQVGAIAGGPDGLPYTLAVDERRHRAFLTAGAATSRGPVTSNRIAVIDTARMQTLRTIPEHGFVDTPSVDGQHGKILLTVGRTSGNLVEAFDTRSGRLLRTMPLPGAERIAVAAGAGMALVTLQGGAVAALDLRTWGIRWRTEVPGLPITLALDTRRGVAYVGTVLPDNSARLLALDVHTGAVSRGIALGVEPDCMQVDVASGRLVIAGQLLQGQDRWAWLPGWIRQRLPWVPQAPRRSSNGGVSIIAA